MDATLDEKEKSLIFWNINEQFRYKNRFIGLSGRVFANGLGDLNSMLGRVVPNKMVLDTALLNTQQYKVKGKMEQSRERSSALLYTSLLELLKREPSGRPRLRSPT